MSKARIHCRDYGGDILTTANCRLQRCTSRLRIPSGALAKLVAVSRRFRVIGEAGHAITVFSEVLAQTTGELRLADVASGANRECSNLAPKWAQVADAPFHAARWPCHVSVA
jgi:hypothetical protein